MAADAYHGDATLRALHDLSVTASTASAPAEVARAAVQLCAPLLRSDGGVVYDFNPRTGLLEPLWDTPSPVSEAPVPPGAGMIGLAFSTCAPVLIADYSKWEHALPETQRRGMVSALAVPMIAGDRPIGVLGVWSYDQRPFDEDDVRLLSLFAAQVAPALETARRAAERVEQTAVLAALNDLAIAASGVLEPAALAQLTVERARDLLGAASAALVWLDRDRDRGTRLADNDTEVELPDAVDLAHGLVGEVVSTGRARSVGDYKRYERAYQPVLGSSINSVAAVPLLVGDLPMGALVARSPAHNYFDEAKLELMALLAAQVAPALQAAELHAELRSSEVRFRSLFETIACGVLVQGPMGEVIDANRAAEEMFGLSLEQMRGRHSTDLWTVSEAGSRPAMLALQARVPVRNHSFYIRRQDGEVRWLQADSIPVVDAEGKAVLVVSSIIDITERHRAEDALRESEERFRAVFDRAGIGICRLDLAGVIEEANPALCAMLGRSREALAGVTLESLVHPDDWNPSEVSAVVNGASDSANLEIRSSRPDGSMLWGNATLTAVVGTPEGSIETREQPRFLIVMIEDVTARKAQEAALAHQALHDALTELPNRTLLLDRLHLAIRVASRERQMLALLMMDLDRFKEVNDTFGHHSGDALLREVAARLRGELRGSDTVARLGGDEFAVLLTQVDDPDGAVITARKLLRMLERAFVVEGEHVHVGASLGIAMYPSHGADADLLMRHADVAMYVAKRAGSGYAVYQAETDQHSPGRLSMIADLRQAIDRGQLELHYQPEVDVRTGAVAGVEALVRWRHPVEGLLMPDQFIGLAEHTGIIRPLGLWVLAAAVEQVAVWQDEGRAIPVSVNLSMRNLHDPVLVDTVADLLQAHATDPSLLKFEITESTLMADPELALRVVRQLTAIGLSLAIDDFGTGYSSLAYLRRLPVTELKIDRSFVLDLVSEENARVIVRSAIDLGHNLGLKVVAEGVEDEAILAIVRAAGCDLVQGNLLCPAVPAGDLPRGPLKFVMGSAET
jgi:diguanylate cyclase (GGDEF)-like protein/PAS domain S-box-containing protein